MSKNNDSSLREAKRKNRQMGRHTQTRCRSQASCKTKTSYNRHQSSSAQEAQNELCKA